MLILTSLVNALEIVKITSCLFWPLERREKSPVRQDSQPLVVGEIRREQGYVCFVQSGKTETKNIGFVYEGKGPLAICTSPTSFYSLEPVTYLGQSS